MALVAKERRAELYAWTDHERLARQGAGNRLPWTGVGAMVAVVLMLTLLLAAGTGTTGASPYAVANSGGGEVMRSVTHLLAEHSRVPA
jgi:hypothetical protein